MKSLKIVWCVCACILIIVIFTKMFLKSDNKIQINGNNKSIQEIEEYFLNIDSYKTTMIVNVKSNKNENNYTLKQRVQNNICEQEIIEPKSMEGMKITYKEGTLEIKNTELNISKIYENYPYISNNLLFLTDFLSEYKKSDGKKIEEKDNDIIMKIDSKNKYNAKCNLYIDRKTLKPKTLEIIDMNENTRVYIIYNEIEFNI